ncbi:MAG: 6-phosphofructokinase [Deltaproteobacteria bacterium]|nr:6-phosphofructokinase [Deltaproteobacteria bacterium]
MSKISRIAILHGGGPAPGSAAVFEGAVKTAAALGIEIWGIPYGFSGLRKGDISKASPLSAADVEGASQQGGTFLPTHRASLHGDSKFSENAVSALKGAKIEGIIVVGGEDSGSSAYVLEQTAKSCGAALAVVHVAKTIDGDIYHPSNLPTFGVDSAAKEAARDLLACNRELVANPERCYLVGIMGRSSGELARRAAEEAADLGAPPDLVLVPEIFSDLVPMEIIRNVITGAIIKARSRGKQGIIVLCSEGVLERCTEESVKHLIADAPLDDHGHLQHSRIQFAYHMARLVEDFHERIGLTDSSGKPVPVTSIEVGYGRLRCGAPSPFDREYCLAVGQEAVKFIKNGSSGATLFYRGEGAVEAHPFVKSVNASTRRMRTRPMDLNAYKRLLKKEVPFFEEKDLFDERFHKETRLSGYAFAVRFAGAAAATDHLL